jgi:(2S)-methylsuccinyl-CoA dehydrogenase
MTGGLRAQAEHLLAATRARFEVAVRRTAEVCAIDGKVDVQGMDAHQGACYELALAAAELLAADTSIAEARGELDTSLALAFAADAIVAVAARLESIELDIGLDASSGHASADMPALAALRRSVASSYVLADLGQRVTATGGDVGAVVLDDATTLAQDVFRRFASDVVAPLAETIHRCNLTVPEEVLEPMREMGVFGLAIPESFGGSAPGEGSDTLMMLAVTEALSEASLAAAGSLITRPEILARALLAGGTALQKETWLPRIAAGNPLCAIAITEPDYGSDVAGLGLRARRAPGGWVLNGAKTWCTFAGKAGLLMVVARTGEDRTMGHRGLSVFLVEKASFDGHDFVFEQPGHRGRLEGRAIPTIGYRGMHSFDLSFTDFFVPDTHLLGAEPGLGRGFYFTMAGMTGGRIQTAARAAGVMRAALKAAVRYSQDRKVFAAPLADFPLTRIKIARMASRAAACRWLTFAVGRLMDAGGGRVEANLAKLFACRSAELVTREAMQIHGGMGYAEETPASRYFVDARVLSIFEGAEETLALKVIAKDLLESLP